MSIRSITITLTDVPVPEEVSIFCKIHNFDIVDLISALIYPGLNNHIILNFNSFQCLISRKTVLSDLLLNSISKE